jgi:hypothetical protein
MAEVSDIGAGARPDRIISHYHLDDEQAGITAIGELREAYGRSPAFVISGDHAVDACPSEGYPVAPEQIPNNPTENAEVS